MGLFSEKYATEKRYKIYFICQIGSQKSTAKILPNKKKDVPLHPFCAKNAVFSRKTTPYI